MKVGDLLSLPVSSLAYGGDGVGRMGDFVVFVSGALPGEECRVGLREVHRHYALAEVETITTPSPDRVVPPCPVFGACGGCQWQMLSYPAQLRAKRQLVTEALERLGGLQDPEVEPTIGMDDPWRFRNKAQFPVAKQNGKVQVGYYRRGTHDLVGFEACAIQHSALDRVRSTFQTLWEAGRLSVYDENSPAPGLRHIVARIGQGTGEVLVILVLSQGTAPAPLMEEARKALPEMVGLALNHNSRSGNVILGERFTPVWGRDHLFETLGSLRLRVSAGSFFQTNTLQTEVLYRKVLELAEPSAQEKVLDLYSGVGGIALSLAPKAKTVLGIEESPSAHRDAGENASANGIGNVRFLAGRVEKHLDALRGFDLVIVDPPRSGVSPAVLSALCRTQARRLIYVSCNPTTLARDIQFLCAQGFRLSRVVPVDLFPHSFHIETVARLDR